DADLTGVRGIARFLIGAAGSFARNFAAFFTMVCHHGPRVTISFPWRAPSSLEIPRETRRLTASIAWALSSASQSNSATWKSNIVFSPSTRSGTIQHSRELESHHLSNGYRSHSAIAVQRRRVARTLDFDL